MNDSIVDPIRKQVVESYKQGFIYPQIDVDDSFAEDFRRLVGECEKASLIHRSLGVPDELVLYELDNEFGLERRSLTIDVVFGEREPAVRVSDPYCIYCNNPPFTAEDGELFCPVCD